MEGIQLSEKLMRGLQGRWEMNGWYRRGQEEAACMIPKTVFKIITLPFIKRLLLNTQL